MGEIKEIKRCNHDERFKGILFTTNGCLACELEKMISENERLGLRIKELGAELQREEQAHIMSVYDLNIRIAGLGEGVETLKEDALIMALRLLGEDENSFSPETREVMNRWRPKCLKVL